MHNHDIEDYAYTFRHGNDNNLIYTVPACRMSSEALNISHTECIDTNIISVQ